jgi:hypothetical protein
MALRVGLARQADCPREFCGMTAAQAGSQPQPTLIGRYHKELMVRH